MLTMPIAARKPIPQLAKSQNETLGRHVQRRLNDGQTLQKLSSDDCASIGVFNCLSDGNKLPQRW